MQKISAGCCLPGFHYWNTSTTRCFKAPALFAATILIYDVRNEKMHVKKSLVKYVEIKR